MTAWFAAGELADAFRTRYPQLTREAADAVAEHTLKVLADGVEFGAAVGLLARDGASVSWETLMADAGVEVPR